MSKSARRPRPAASRAATARAAVPVLALVLAPAAGRAQTASVTPPAIAAPARAAGGVQGRVTSPAGASLGDVLVIVAPADAPGDPAARRGATTDDAGRFAVRGLAPGQYAVTARRLGLAEQAVTVTVEPGGSASVDFRLAERAVVVAPVQVTASREARRRAEQSATVDGLDGAEVRLARAAHPAQVMKRVPGVYVSQLSGEGSSVAIRQPITTRPMYLYLEDGVPVRATGFFNHNALYEVNLPQAGGIEVLKGPGTAAYGSDAIGGVVNALTRPAPATPSAEASVEGGAYGYGRLLLTGGGMRGRDGVRADLNLTRVGGWRAQNAYARQSATVRWDHAGDRGLTVRGVATATHVDQNDAIGQDRAQFDARDPLNRSPLAYRRVQAARASLAVERTEGVTSWGVTPYARYNRLELLPNWQLTFDPQAWDTRNTSLGVLARVRRDAGRLPNGRERARLTAGADLEASPGASVVDQLRLFTRGTQGATVFDSATVTRRLYDYEVTYRQASPYAQAELVPFAGAPGLRLDAGARYDWMGYTYRTNLAAVDTGRWRIPPGTTRDYTRLSPKAGVTWELARALNVYGSYRAGFRAPQQSQLFQQGTTANTVDLRPVRVGAYELGARGQLGARVLYGVSAYDMTLRDDILTFTNTLGLREARNAGATRHRGVEASVGAMLLPALRLDAAYSVASHRYVDYTPVAARPAAGASGAVAAVRYAGRRVEQAPTALGNALLTWSPRLLRGGRVAAEWSQTGRYVTGYVLSADAATRNQPVAPCSTPGHALWALHANAQVTPRLELFGRATNLTDRTYAEVAAFNFNDRLQPRAYTPGNPRTVYAGVRAAVAR
jgi:outer membrane receptor protein involved in Fe transport